MITNYNKTWRKKRAATKLYLLQDATMYWSNTTQMVDLSNSISPLLIIIFVLHMCLTCLSIQEVPNTFTVMKTSEYKKCYERHSTFMPLYSLLMLVTLTISFWHLCITTLAYTDNNINTKSRTA